MLLTEEMGADDKGSGGKGADYFENEGLMTDEVGANDSGGGS